MVENVLDPLIQRLIARALLVLRRYATMPQLANRDYDDVAQRKGDTVDVPVVAPSQAKDVVPSNVKPEPVNTKYTKIPITLDQWKSADFGMTDKDRTRIMREQNFLPDQVNSAATAIVEAVDDFLLGFYKKANQYVGAANKKPFDGSLDNAIDAGVLLKEAKIPKNSDCYIVTNPGGEGTAMKNQQLLGANMSGDLDAIRDGTIMKKVGFYWFVNQGVVYHESEAIGNGKVAVNVAAGATTLTADKDLKAVEGDLFTIAGDTTSYVVKSFATATRVLEFYPALAEDANANAGLSFVGSHYNSLAFHPQAFALATRPLEPGTEGLGSVIRTMTDMQSGLSLRLEVSRQHKQETWEYDILYGGQVIRPEFLVRIIHK